MPETLGFSDTLGEQHVDVIEEETSPVLQSDLPWRSSGRQIGGLRENPRIAQHPATDEHSFDASPNPLHDLLGLHAVAAAEHGNREVVGDARHEIPVRRPAITL